MTIHLTESEPSATVDQLNEIERKVGCVLPQQYKEFLLAHNGGRPKPSCFKIQWNGQEWAEGWDADMIDFFLSVPADFLDYYDTHKGRVPDDTIPIAYDPGSNLILLGIGENNHGKVFFWMRSEEPDEDDEENRGSYHNVGFVANSLNAFLESLFEEERQG